MGQVLRIGGALCSLLLGGCVFNPALFDAESDDSGEPTRLTAIEGSYPLCAESAAQSGPRIRDLTIPFHLRVYITPAGPCVPAQTIAGTAQVLRQAAVIGPSDLTSEPRLSATALDDLQAARRVVPAVEIDVLRGAFSADVAAGRLEVAAIDSGGVKLVVRGDASFRTASARPRRALKELLQRIGSVAAQGPASLLVTGHTDNRPVRTRLFPDNDALSGARARAAAELLATSTGPGFSIRTVGQGAQIPVASNATAAGRALNRRIEVHVLPAGGAS